MSLDDFLSKKRKDSKKPTLEDESLTESIPKDELPSSLSSEDFWSVLVETVKKDVVLFPNLKAYIEDKILPREPDISPQELSLRLNISLGTAMVLLSELKSDSEK